AGAAGPHGPAGRHRAHGHLSGVVRFVVHDRRDVAGSGWAPLTGGARRRAHANREVSERPEPRTEDAMFQPDLLKGKRILVTGGGTGLGRSMSHRFLELGANVVICGRREDVLEQTAEELTKETGAEIETVRCDVRLPDAVEAMMDRIWQKRTLDILVNNAAGQILAPTHKMSSRAIDAVLGIVLHGSAYCTVAAGRRWIDAGERNKVVMAILTVSALLGSALHRAVGHGQGGRARHDQEPRRRMGAQGNPHLR